MGVAVLRGLGGTLLEWAGGLDWAAEDGEDWAEWRAFIQVLCQSYPGQQIYLLDL